MQWIFNFSQVCKTISKTRQINIQQQYIWASYTKLLLISKPELAGHFGGIPLLDRYFLMTATICPGIWCTELFYIVYGIWLDKSELV